MVDLILHENKNKVLGVYTGVSEKIGTLITGKNLRNTHIRFESFDAYEIYINSIDDGYDSDGSIFIGYIFKLNTPQFNLVNRSQYGKDTDFKQNFVEYIGDKLYIPTGG